MSMPAFIYLAIGVTVSVYVAFPRKPSLIPSLGEVLLWFYVLWENYVPLSITALIILVEPTVYLSNPP